MKERPILFSAPMVRAILAGKKTQTRRAINIKKIDHRIDWIGQTCDGWAAQEVSSGGQSEWPELADETIIRCPYGNTGDRLYVKESYYKTAPHFVDSYQGNATDYDGDPWNIAYRADMSMMEAENARQLCKEIITERYQPRLRPSIHMPRWASRITLEITGIRAERLHDITEADAMAEGCTCGGKYSDGGFSSCKPCDYEHGYTHREEYHWLWNSINGDGSWDTNPYVWVVSFKRIEATK